MAINLFRRDVRRDVADRDALAVAMKEYRPLGIKATVITGAGALMINLVTERPAVFFAGVTFGIGAALAIQYFSIWWHYEEWHR